MNGNVSRRNEHFVILSFFFFHMTKTINTTRHYKVPSKTTHWALYITNYFIILLYETVFQSRREASTEQN